VPVPGARATAVLTLAYNLDGASRDDARGDGDFDGKKHTIAAELLPATLVVDGVPFTFGSTGAGEKNVLVPAGQTVTVPAGPFNRVYVLASAVGADVPATFGVGAATRSALVREWQGPVGQWWSRLTDIAPSLREPFAVQNGGGQNAGLVVQYDQRTGAVTGIDQIRPAFVKRDAIAWIGTHRHDPNGNEPYVSSYMFKYAIDLPAGAREIRLPSDARLRIFAMTAVREPYLTMPAGFLYVPEFPDRPPVVRK
jgi:alpha-mannosidase